MPDAAGSLERRHTPSPLSSLSSEPSQTDRSSNSTPNSAQIEPRRPGWAGHPPRSLNGVRERCLFASTLDVTPIIS
jgi:hypothetical protein